MALLLHLALVPRRLECRGSLQQQPKQRLLVQPQRARIFWDLDNINARSPEHALVVGHRLKRAVQRLTGVQAPALCAFANERTVELLKQRGSSEESWDAALDVLQAEVFVAGLEKDAADLLMQRDMVSFAKEHGPAAAVICVTNDQGFAAALEKCGHMGAFTVAVGTYLRQAGFNWSRRPSKLPVPAAANCIVAWHPGRSAQNSAAERKLLAHWQKRIDGSSGSSGSESTLAVTAAACGVEGQGQLMDAAGVPASALLDNGSASSAARPAQVAIRAHKGVCCTRWLNPARPPQLLTASDGAAAEAAAAGADSQP